MKAATESVELTKVIRIVLPPPVEAETANPPIGWPWAQLEEVVEIQIGLAEEVTDETRFRKWLALGIELAEEMSPSGVIVHSLAPGLTEPEWDLAGKRLAVLVIATENTGKWTRANWPGLDHWNHKNPEYKLVSVEHWLAVDHRKPGNSIASAVVVRPAASTGAAGKIDPLANATAAQNIVLMAEQSLSKSSLKGCT